MKRFLTLQKMVMEGETVPRGYGLAYVDSMMGYSAIAYPVPLNLIARAARWIWYRLKVPRWGDKLLRTIGREKGLRIESTHPKRPSPRYSRIYLNGREITNQLTGLDVRMRKDEAITATLHYIGNIEIPKPLVMRKRWTSEDDEQPTLHYDEGEPIFIGGASKPDTVPGDGLAAG